MSFEDLKKHCDDIMQEDNGYRQLLINCFFCRNQVEKLSYIKKLVGTARRIHAPGCLAQRALSLFFCEKISIGHRYSYFSVKGKKVKL